MTLGLGWLAEWSSHWVGPVGFADHRHWAGPQGLGLDCWAIPWPSYGLLWSCRAMSAGLRSHAHTHMACWSSGAAAKRKRRLVIGIATVFHWRPHRNKLEHMNRERKGGGGAELLCELGNPFSGSTSIGGGRDVLQIVVGVGWAAAA